MQYELEALILGFRSVADFRQDKQFNSFLNVGKSPGQYADNHSLSRILHVFEERKREEAIS
jgi:hypothetical protein